MKDYQENNFEVCKTNSKCKALAIIIIITTITML